MAKLKLILGDKERIVDNIEIRIVNGCIGVSLVNDGHDDLFDLGFKVGDLMTVSLKIVPVEEPRHDYAQGLVPMVEVPNQGLVETGQVQQLWSDDPVNSDA